MPNPYLHHTNEKSHALTPPRPVLQSVPGRPGFGLSTFDPPPCAILHNRTFKHNVFA